MKTNNRYSFSVVIGSVAFYFPLVFFLLLVLLSFFTYPSAEDLPMNYWDHTMGVGPYVKDLLKSNSRYFSIPVESYLINGRFLPDHYYVVALGFWLWLWGGLFLFLRAIARRVFDIGMDSKWFVWLAAVLPLAICSILFQPSSMFYWVTGSMTYLMGFLLFLFQMIILLRAAWRGHAMKVEVATAIVLAVAAVGCNEITMYFELLVLGWFQLIYFSAKGKMLQLVNVLLVVVLACIIFLILPGGASTRSGHYKVHRGIVDAAIVTVSYMYRDYVRLIVSPMVWLCLLLAGAMGAITREEVRSRLAGSYWFRPWVCCLPALAGAGGFYFLIYFVSGEVLPPRANGLLLVYIFFFLLVAAYANGIRFPMEFGFFQRLYHRPVVRLLVVLVFLGSPLFFQVVEDAGVGWMYSRVVEKRKRELVTAKDRRKVVIQSYEDDYQSASPAILPKEIRDRLMHKAPRYPTTMFYMDPFADTGQITFYAEYYGIDTIRYLGQDHTRFGLRPEGIPNR